MKKGDIIKIGLFKNNNVEHTDEKEVIIDFFTSDIVIECVSVTRINGLPTAIYTVMTDPTKIMRRNDVKGLTKWAVVQ